MNVKRGDKLMLIPGHCDPTVNCMYKDCIFFGFCSDAHASCWLCLMQALGAAESTAKEADVLSVIQTHRYGLSFCCSLSVPISCGNCQHMQITMSDTLALRVASACETHCVVFFWWTSFAVHDWFVFINDQDTVTSVHPISGRGPGIWNNMHHVCQESGHCIIRAFKKYFAPNVAIMSPAAQHACLVNIPH